jgi:hypothetical protein
VVVTSWVAANVTLAGRSVKFATAVPVPVRVIFCVAAALLPAVYWMGRVAVSAIATDGVKVRPTVQLAPAGTDAPQVVAASRLKAPQPLSSEA